MVIYLSLFYLYNFVFKTIKYLDIFILILAVFAFQSNAQVDYLTPKTASKKTQEAYKKAYAYVQQNELDLAIQSFQKLIKKTPEFINAYIQLGYLYERLQQNDKALSSFKQSLEIAPDYHPKVHMAIARIAMKNKYGRDNLETLTLRAVRRLFV